MIRLIILGAPGSGKGSQCKWIKEDYDVPHISTGDILRKNIAEETKSIWMTCTTMRRELQPLQTTFLLI